MIVTAHVDGAEGLAARLERALVSRLSAAALAHVARARSEEADRAGVALTDRTAGHTFGAPDPAAGASKTGPGEALAVPSLPTGLSGLRRRP